MHFGRSEGVVLVMALTEVPRSISDNVYSWILFKRSRDRLPSMEIAAPQIAVSQWTLHENFSDLQVGTFLEQITKPSLFVTEKQGYGMRIGSGWELVDTGINGPMTEGRGEYCLTEKVSRTRYAVFEVQGRLRMIVTRKESEATLSFLMGREVDGGRTLDTYGLLDRNTGNVLASYTEMAYKSCPFCEVRDAICECAPHLTETYFRDQLAMRQGIRSVSSSMVGAFYDDYLRLCMSGRFLYKVNGKPGATIKVKFLTSGDLLNKSLGIALRSEIECILKPTRGLPSTEDRFLLDTVNDGRKGQRIIGAETLNNLNNSHKNLKTSSYSCPICHVPIKRKYDIQRHILGVHAKVRAFDCKLCTQTFQQRGHLNAHIVYTHEKHKGSVCSQCGKAFAGGSKLKRHFDTVHGNIRNFACNICEKKYKDLKALKHHNSVKHGDVAANRSEEAYAT